MSAKSPCKDLAYLTDQFAKPIAVHSQDDCPVGGPVQVGTQLTHVALREALHSIWGERRDIIAEWTAQQQQQQQCYTVPDSFAVQPFDSQASAMCLSVQKLKELPRGCSSQL